jgi:hypothetical protein
MFDKIEVHEHKSVEGPRYPQHVHEHRAPTDESIKLYHELLEKARAEVLSFVVHSSGVEGNVLSHVKVACNHLDLDGTTKVKIAFVLNGKEHVIEAGIDNEGTRLSMARAIVQELLRHVGEDLWGQLPNRLPLDR